MLKELKVVLSTSIAKLRKGMRDAVSVTQTTAKQTSAAADKINQSMNNAFGSDSRANILKTNQKILEQKETLNKLKTDLNQLISSQNRLKKGSDAYKDGANKIKSYRNQIRFATQELSELNTSLRDNKTNLANSRLAAEDNQSALESMSRTLTAVTGAVLLMDSENESLRNTMKVLNVTFAATNAIVSINNLRLRENQLFLKASAAASKLLSAELTRMQALFLGLGASAFVLFLANFSKIRDALTKTKSNFNGLSASISDVIDDTIEEISNVKILTAVVLDNNQSQQERVKALNQLQKQYPSYFENLKNDIDNTKELVTQRNKLIGSLIAEAKLKSAKEKLEESLAPLIEDDIQLQKDLFREQNKILKIQKEAARIREKGTKRTKEDEAALRGFIGELGTARESESVFLKQKKELNSQINKLTESYLNYASALGVSATAQDEESESGGGGTNNSDKLAKKAQDAAVKRLNIEKETAINLARVRANQQKNTASSEALKAAIESEFARERLKIQEEYYNKIAQLTGVGYDEVAAKQLEFYVKSEQIQKNAFNSIQEGRNKDTDAELSSIKLTYDQRKDALEGMLALEDRITQQSLANLAQAYSDGLINQETYELAKLELTKEGLIARLKALEAFGANTAAIEQKIADISLKIDKKKNSDTVKNAEQTAVQIGSIISREFGKVGRDIGDALSNAFSKAFEQTSELAELDIEILKKQNEELKYAMQDSTKSQVQQLQAKKQLMENEAKILEKSQSNMSKLQSAMLVTVADFLESLGKGLIAAGLAVETFQKSLASNPLLAVAAGVAAVAAAAFVRSKISKGVAFAEGGIVSGPTLGLVGEYPGASTNPEVIAPLDKLKNIIGGGMSQDGGYIAETRVSGRDLALVLSRYEKDRTRG